MISLMFISYPLSLTEIGFLHHLPECRARAHNSRSSGSCPTGFSKLMAKRNHERLYIVRREPWAAVAGEVSVLPIRSWKKLTRLDRHGSPEAPAGISGLFSRQYGKLPHTDRPPRPTSMEGGIPKDERVPSKGAAETRHKPIGKAETMKTVQSYWNVLGFGATGFPGLSALAQGFFRRETAAAPSIRDAFEGAYENGVYQLPPLPYEYDALEPVLDGKTLTIHHNRHHAAYVKGLNEALQKLDAARKDGDYRYVDHLSQLVAFHGSGHVLHTLFWHSMSPDKPEVPGRLADALTESFGSVENARKQFAAATKKVEGSGWGLLVYEPMADRLLILQSEKHQNLTLWNTIPLLVCDVWEHAYYLKYQNDRPAWVDNFMTVANWSFAATRLEQVKDAMGR
jgi:Fe-Mn family superoxide dismutase